MIKRLCTLALVGAGLCGGSASAFFSVVYDSTYSNYGGGNILLLYGASSLTAGGAGLLGADLIAGEHHTVGPGWTPFPNGYCLTPDQYIGHPDSPWKGQFENLTANPTLYNAASNLTATEANTIAWLADIHYTAAGYSGIPLADLELVQKAIWMEIGVEGTGHTALLSNAVFNGTSIVLSDGTYTYDSTKTYGYAYLRAYTWSGVGIQGQDLIHGTVPEPFSLALGAACIGLAAFRRRRR